MTTIDTALPLLRARHGLRLSAEQRAVRTAVARWALSSGRPLTLDAATVILASKEFEASVDGRPFNRWSASGTVTFLWATVPEFCAARNVVVPAGLAESLWTWFDFLAHHRQFASGSSTMGALREVLVDTAGLTRSGRASRRAPRGPGEVAFMPVRTAQR